MYIVKFIKSAHFEDAATKGKIRIGTFGYFKETEDSNLQDQNEDTGKLIIEGNNMVYTSFR